MSCSDLQELKAEVTEVAGGLLVGPAPALLAGHAMAAAAAAGLGAGENLTRYLLTVSMTSPFSRPLPRSRLNIYLSECELFPPL